MWNLERNTPKEIWNSHVDQLTKEKKTSKEKSRAKTKKVVSKKEDVLIDGGNFIGVDDNHA